MGLYKGTDKILCGNIITELVIRRKITLETITVK